MSVGVEVCVGEDVGVSEGVAEGEGVEVDVAVAVSVGVGVGCGSFLNSIESVQGQVYPLPSSAYTM